MWALNGSGADQAHRVDSMLIAFAGGETGAAAPENAAEQEAPMQPTGNITRRHVLVGTALCGIIFATPRLRAAPVMPQPLSKRKNIDALTPTELDNYKHAVDILTQRSNTNPTTTDGYVHQANLHNRPRTHPDSSVGACEHASEQFFPWHRPHLSGFEKLLRASDPPRTADIAIPYWDWTKPPSGRMVPKAFEDTASPLFNSGRRTTGSPPMWDGNEIRDMVREPIWEVFAGRPKGPNSSYGDFEIGPHNGMHGSIGSTMGNPRTAANDPIYWSFHAFVDLVWARWQRLHQQAFACGSCILWLEPDSFTVDQTLSTKDWNYEYDYDFEPDGPAVTLVAATGTSIPLPLTESTERSATAAVNVAPNDKRKFIKIEKVAPLSEASYRIQVYVHPADIKLASLSEQQRRRYLVRTLTIWQSAGHHPEASDVLVDVTKAFAQPGPNRVVSIVTEPVPAIDAAGLESTPAPLPKMQDLFRGFAIEER
jgi:Common central domain of tyrosinase